MEEPEPEPRHPVVILGIAEVQKSKDMLIDEVEPKETSILTWRTMQCVVEIGRVAQRGQYVPGCSDETHDQQRIEGPKLTPGLSRKQLAGENEISEDGAHRKDDSDQSLQQQSKPKTHTQKARPKAWAQLGRVQQAQEGPHSEGNRQR